MKRRRREVKPCYRASKTLKSNQTWESKISGLAPTRLNDEMAWRGWRGPRRRPRLPVISTRSGGFQWQSFNVKGRSWNTGDPSFRLAEPCASVGRVDIVVARPETKRWQEESGSLSTPIVVFEPRGTANGQDPASSEGGCPNTRTNKEPCIIKSTTQRE